MTNAMESCDPEATGGEPGKGGPPFLVHVPSGERPARRIVNPEPRRRLGHGFAVEPFAVNLLREREGGCETGFHSSERHRDRGGGDD
jgi:hypothetical protein